MKRRVVLKKNPIAIANSEEINNANTSQNKRAGTSDSSSKFTGKFCWEEIEGIAVPFIMRSTGEMLAEINMLKKSLFKKQLEILKGSVFDMACSPKRYQATIEDKILLNEINSVHCDYYFAKKSNMPCSFLLAKKEIIKLYEVLNVFYNLVTKKTISDPNCGYILIDENNTPIPFVTLEGIGIVVPLFFFECPEVMHMKMELEDHWALVYFKLFCKLLSIFKTFYDQQTLSVITLENIKQLVPEIHEFTFVTTLPSNANISELIRSTTKNIQLRGDKKIQTKHQTSNNQSKNSFLQSGANMLKFARPKKATKTPNRIRKLPKILSKNIRQRNKEKIKTKSQSDKNKSENLSGSAAHLVDPSSEVVAPSDGDRRHKFEQIQTELQSVNDKQENHLGILSGAAPYFANPFPQVVIPGGYILQAPPVLSNTLFQPQIPNQVQKLPEIASKNIRQRNKEKIKTEPQSDKNNAENLSGSAAHRADLSSQVVAPSDGHIVQSPPIIVPENIERRDKFEQIQTKLQSNNNKQENHSGILSGAAPYLVDPSPQVVAPGGYILQAPPVLSNTLFQPPTAFTNMSNSYVLNPLSGILTSLSSAGYILPFQGTVTEQATQQQESMQPAPINMKISNSIVIVQQDKNTASIIPEAATNLIPNSLVPHVLTSTSQSGGSTTTTTTTPQKVEISESVKNMPSVVSEMSKKCIKLLRHDLREILYNVTEIPEHFNVKGPLSYRIETKTYRDAKFVCISNSPSDGSSLLINILDVKKFLFPEIDGEKFMSTVFDMKLEIFSLNTSQKAILATYYQSESKDREHLYFLLDEFHKMYPLIKSFFRMARA